MNETLLAIAKYHFFVRRSRVSVEKSINSGRNECAIVTGDDSGPRY
jgi:hypothetical protein